MKEYKYIIEPFKTTVINDTEYKWTAIETTKSNKEAQAEVNEYLKEHPEMHLYHMRHYDDNWGLPETIEKNVIVNFFGYLIITPSIDDKFKDYYIQLNEDQGYDIHDVIEGDFEK